MAIPRTPDPSPGGFLGDLFEGALGGGLGYGGTTAEQKTNAASTQTNEATSKAEQALPSIPGVGDALDAVVAVRRWISDRHNWARIGWFVGGVAMFTVGAALVARPAVEAAAKEAAPLAAAAA